VHQEDPGLKGSGVIVATLDTGIDMNHADLSKNIKDGYNAMAGQDSRNYRDDNGHGTHMAGIIAARMNRLGVVSAAYQAQIVAVKVLDQDGNGRLSDLINGLGWISTNKIRVVNMSLSFSEDSPLLKQAIQRLYTAGMIMVASAGNGGTTCAHDGGGDDGGGNDGGGDGIAQDGGGDDGGGDAGCQTSQKAVHYPARYPWVISVVATNGDDKVTGYSQSGKVDVAAPGGSQSGSRIFSTHKGGGLWVG
jgi:subtilisin family serine protease